MKERQTEIEPRIEQHQQGEGDYRTTLETLISVASRAAEIVERSKTDQKRELIAFVFSLRLPFDLMVHRASFTSWLLAGAKLEMGRTEDALNFLDELQQLSLETHQQMFIPDLHRLRAEALHRLDPKSRRIEEEYQTAAQLARQQGAPALELRAVLGLATWLAETDRARKGRTLLQPVFDRFEEGFGTPDLRAAKSLLDALG